jgi:Legionella pneumophila major outer membrane protein precursor
MRKVFFALAVFSSCAARVCDFYGGVEALYWKPAHCPIPFIRAEADNPSPDVHKVFTLRGDYDWGFRVTAGGSRDCKFTDLAYHWVETSDCGFADNRDGFFDSKFNLPGNEDDVEFARAKMHTRYQGIDWRFGYAVSLCEAELRFYGDIRWTDLDLRVRAAGPVSSSRTDFIDLHSSYDAAGIGAGIEGRFPIWCGLSLGTRVTVSSLIGDSKVKRFVADNVSAAETFVPFSATTINPLIDVRLELSYDRCVCGRNWSAKVGYELDYIFDSLVYWTTSTEDQPSTGNPDFPITGCNNFGYGGIYFGLSASF